ncbi:MAG: hypothetical protein ACHQ4G_01410 [Opitutales bacterium]
MAHFVWLLADQGVSFASGSDASGYLNCARLIDRGEFSTPIRPVSGLQGRGWAGNYQQPLGFAVQPGTGHLIPTYPIGLPLHLLAAAKLVGWQHSAILVNILTALAIGLLMLALGRYACGLDWAWVLASVAVFWACPLFLFVSFQPLSDALAATWTLAALAAAWGSRRHWTWALAAGAAVGMAVLVRPTNLLVVAPVAVLLGLGWRRWLALGLGGLPFASALAFFNLHTYGQIFTTGYGDIDSLVQAKFVPHNAAHFAAWIVGLLTPFVLLALGLPWLARRQPRLVSAFSLWVAALVGFYLFYYHSGETWWYLRFILPVFPIFILSAAMVAQRGTALVASAAWRGALVAFVVLFVLDCQFIVGRRLNITNVSAHDYAYFNAVHWLRVNAPANAVMVAMQASGALHYYTSFPLIRYDLMDARMFAHACAVAKANGQPMYAPLFPSEIEPVVGARLGGDWQKIATIDFITIWRLESGETATARPHA